MRRLDVDAGEIVRLYTEAGLRGPAIAEKLGCGLSIVYARLEEAGVVRSRRARIVREDVIERYQSGTSAFVLGRDYGVAPQTILRHLRSWGVTLRSHAESLQPLGRVPCPASVGLRAYILGFVWGDLAVARPGGKGCTIAVLGSTTDEGQVDLVRRLFEPFGRVTAFHGARAISMRASLDPSFGFLLDKYGDSVPAWIAGPVAQAAFAAGYIDAEGSFGVYDGRARFKLDSCDELVHLWLRDWLSRIGVHHVGRRVESKGVRSNGLPLNHDLYRLNVNDALALRRLVATIEPFSRHARRQATMTAAAQNVADRMRARAFP